MYQAQAKTSTYLLGKYNLLLSDTKPTHCKDDGVLDSYPTKGTGQKVRRNDRLATDFGRVGDFFCRCGVYRGGVSGDWDQREQRRYAICACISN